MEIEEKYLTYNEYVEIFGDNLSEVPFNLLEYTARKKIDERTFGRLIGKGQNYKEVKYCIADMINIIKTYTQQTNKSISSESTDGYSVSYNQITKEFINSKNYELETTISTYLATLIIDNIPVLYRGTDVN